MSRTIVFLFAVGLTLAIAGAAWAEGNVLFEYWMNIGGTSINDLTSNGAYPWGPSSSEYREDLKSKVDWADNMGTRARSYLVPPETGEYTFWISGDDDCQLWLSSDDTAANAELIATVVGWTAVEAWDWQANQKSGPIPLQAGQPYYIEMLMKEGGGGDSVTAAWAGPGIGDEPVVIRGQYLSLFVETRRPAYLPVPADGTVDVTNPLLQWTPGKTAVVHDVYFGTNPEPGPAEYKGPMPVALYYHSEPLIPGETYYWRVDEVEADGVTVHTGDVWSFTVKPVKAYNSSPYEGAIYRNLDTTLSWKAGEGAISHNIYFGTSEEAVRNGAASVLRGGGVETSFDPGGLAYAATYYWRIDEVQSDGRRIIGDVWSFTTMLEGFGAAKLEVWNDIGGTAVSDLTNDPRYPGSPDLVDEVPNFEAPSDAADNYGAKLSAWLTVPIAGDYTFWVASDDASQLFLGADHFSAVQIAEVTGWTASRAWDWNASQKSAPIHLDEGKYYLAALVKEGGGGDNLSAAWQGPAVPQRELIGGGFLEPFVALWADLPIPADGAGDVHYLANLSWTPGVKAAAHNVYLGTDKNAVANATPTTAGIFQGQAAEPTFTPAPLAWNKTYYWRVDEVNEAEADSPWKGTVWSFSVPDYVPVITEPETLNYDNTVEPFVSEAAFEYGAPQNWTVNGITNLALWIKGGLHKLREIEPGTYSMTARSGDVWGSTDNFRFFYKELTGDGAIVAKVISQTRPGTDWAKAGVMVRQSLDANASHGFMIVTPNLRRAFQNRPATGGNSLSAHSAPDAIALPLWVRLERAGNQVTAFYSTDGATWTQQPDTENTGGDASPNPQTLELGETVYVGFAVTSNNTSDTTTAVFSDLAATGTVSDGWQLADIGPAIPGNDPAPVFVTLHDSAGKSATVAHPGNPNVVYYGDWTPWKILLSKFSGVNLKAITKVVVGVGDGKADGTGSIQIDDIRVVKPIKVAVENFSFELPGTPDKWFAPPSLAKVVGFDKVPGWKTDKKAPHSGLVRDIRPTQGKWCAYLTAGDPSIWQLTGHTIVEGELFQLDVDAVVLIGAVRDNKDNLKVSLYYDDGGKRVRVASTSRPLPFDPWKYSVSFSAPDARQAVGHKIGIEVANVSDNTIGVDNVRLNVK